MVRREIASARGVNGTTAMGTARGRRMFPVPTTIDRRVADPDLAEAEAEAEARAECSARTATALNSPAWLARTSRRAKALRKSQRSHNDVRPKCETVQNRQFRNVRLFVPMLFQAAV